MSAGVPPKASPKRRSSVASSASSPAKYTGISAAGRSRRACPPLGLDAHRSIDAKGGGYRRVEVLTGPGRRRKWSDDDKARIVAETLQPGAVVAEVARRWQVMPAAGVRLAAGDASLALPRRQPDFVPIVRGDADRRCLSRRPRRPARARRSRSKLAGAVLRVAPGTDADAADDGAAGDPGLGGMIALPAGARILLATKPVDFRKGAHSLAALAAEVLGADPFSGAVLVFRSRRADRIKILVWDGSGLVLVWKQLEGGAFRWPAIVDGVLRLTPVEFAALFDGIDWRRVQATREIPTPSAPA